MRVTIAGGGLVGLAMARLLRARGVEAVVIERMQEAEYVARGFMLGQQGHEALADLGLLDDVVRVGRPIASGADGSCAAIAVEVGKALAPLAAGLPVRYGCSVAGLDADISPMAEGKNG